MEGVVFKELNQFHDSRGWLVETYRNDEIDFTPAMSYVSMTRPGIARGPHEHLDQSDFFCFFGHFKLYLWDNRKESTTYGHRITFDTEGKPHVAIVPPKIIHAYKNTGSGDGLVINMPDRLYRGAGKTLPIDEIRYEDDPDSPYMMD